MHDDGQVLYAPEGDALIRLEFGDDDVIFQANRGGFRSIANTLLQFDRDAVGDWSDIHFYPGIELAHDSIHLTLELTNSSWPVEVAGSHGRQVAHAAFAASDHDQARLVPERDKRINVDLIGFDIYIIANRSGFRTLAHTFMQFAADSTPKEERITLRAGIDLVPNSVNLTLQLTAESWLDHIAECLGHAKAEIANIRSQSSQDQATWEATIIQEINDHLKETGQNTVDCGRKSHGFSEKSE
jgi:hypothetical protein